MDGIYVVTRLCLCIMYYSSYIPAVLYTCFTQQVGYVISHYFVLVVLVPPHYNFVTFYQDKGSEENLGKGKVKCAKKIEVVTCDINPHVPQESVS